MYNYYYIKTDCLSNTWNTFEIRNFLHELGFFEEEPNGILAIITSEYSEDNVHVENILKNLEQFLGFRMCCDD